MKAEKNIRSLFGFTQLEMAMLLKIPRGQWSMFEAAKRRLPLPAWPLLTQLLNASQNKQLEKFPAAASQETILETKLHRLLRENEYQMEELRRKLEAMEQKYALSIKALQTTEHLKSVPGFNEDPVLLKMIEHRALKSLKQTGLPELTKLRIKQQLLQYEEKLLKAELEKLSQK
ncbi:hypothetical protein [Flavobacterium wongokense]|uniref:hypothetical protein n=1 Tax=Flavobacterium wongokense TaxID=2910674 RepID=UPI001F36D0E9|nr:hypothetical protein [Flavobacterium sp. WG47]MCF6132479.1 hypothetical protein [Flavobacterium sp. WG47]